MEHTRVVGLIQDGGNGQLGGVSEQARRARRVPHAKHLRGLELHLERIEAPLLCVAPWAAQSRQGGSQGGKAQHKLAVAVGESDEVAHVGALLLHGPVCHSGYLAGVNRDAVLRDDVT